MGEIETFLKAVGKHWWALMSCAIFTGLGVFASYANKNNDWIVHSSYIAAVACVFIACFLAWKDEHEKFLIEQKKSEGSRIEGEMIVALVDSKKGTNDGKFETLTSGCYVSMLICATNMNPTPAYLLLGGTSLDIILAGKSYQGTYEMLPYGRIDYFTEATEIHPSSGYRNISDFFHAGLQRFPMEDGLPCIGWIRFYCAGMDESALHNMNDLSAALTLILTDTHKKQHPIRGTLPLQLGMVRHRSEI